MSFITENAQYLAISLGILIALTNVIVEIIKAIFPERKIHTNIIAVITAIILTVVSSIADANMKGLTLAWFDYVSMLIYGILVAYGAMFGYDKLKEIFEKFKS